MIDKDRIHSQLSLSCEKVITSFDLGEGVGSTINKDRINSQFSLLCEKAIGFVDPGEGEADQQLTKTGSSQQSTFTFT